MILKSSTQSKISLSETILKFSVSVKYFSVDNIYDKLNISGYALLRNDQSSNAK